MASVWRKTLVYLGLVEDDEYDEYAYEEFEPDERQARRPPRRPGHDGYGPRPQPVAPVPSAPRFHLVHPSSFNDAQEVGDKFREGFSVIMNLQQSDGTLGRRLVDFASGLAYGLGGSMQPVAENVFIVTPAGVQFSAEERRKFLEGQGFFDQS